MEEDEITRTYHHHSEPPRAKECYPMFHNDWHIFGKEAAEVRKRAEYTCSYNFSSDRHSDEEYFLIRPADATSESDFFRIDVLGVKHGAARYQKIIAALEMRSGKKGLTIIIY